ncbi:hypothetical protein DEO72_LG4g708 [Vigna unguiculata]|uniref:Uncharacterized protein n=1 Tax=Vigna unguiculata TaxID=3917 RepID=A0A4D6LLT9_VIGUN|nr:hypothetical protein DEO72_LG3g1549 [Vigna unguiculata]QCD89759.1 hypothetical protein DEO72_LG4g708 [Vigna unguiculata]
MEQQRRRDGDGATKTARRRWHDEDDMTTRQGWRDAATEMAAMVATTWLRFSIR